MNSSAYVFGNLGGGFTQYPEDYAHEIYEEFQLKAEAPSQVIIHRDKSIMYYGYIRKLDKEGQYIGLCVLLNGVMLSKMASLFSVFEKVVSEMVSQGELIKMDENGDIIGVAERLDEKHQEVERIVTYLREEVIHWESTATKLPPISYSISNDSCQTFSSSDKDENVVAASVKYGYTCVQKNEGYDTPLLAGLRNVLRQKSGVKDSPQKDTIEIGIQKKKNKIQQKFWWIAAIIVFVVVCISVVKNNSKRIATNMVMDSIATDSVSSEILTDAELMDVSTNATKEDVIRERIRCFWNSFVDFTSSENCFDYCSIDFRNWSKKEAEAEDIINECCGYEGFLAPQDDFGEMAKYGVDFLSLSFNGEHSATALIKVLGDTRLTLKLVYEHGDWYIDDLIHEGMSEKGLMRDYVKYVNDESNHKKDNDGDKHDWFSYDRMIHHLVGTMTDDRGVGNMELKFVTRSDGHVEDVIYKNLDYGGMLKMQGCFTQEGSLQFVGKDGVNDFVMTIRDEGDGTFKGSAVDGKYYLAVWMKAKCDHY